MTKTRERYTREMLQDDSTSPDAEMDSGRAYCVSDSRESRRRVPRPKLDPSPTATGVNSWGRPPAIPGDRAAGDGRVLLAIDCWPVIGPQRARGTPIGQ